MRYSKGHFEHSAQNDEGHIPREMREERAMKSTESIITLAGETI